MPGMNGLDFCKMIRGDCITTPFILYTGQGSEEVAEKAFILGVDDYLRKEVSLASFTLLARNIKQVVEKHQTEKTLNRSVKELEESEGRLRSILNNSLDVIYRFNIQTGRYEYMSLASKTILNFEPEELMAMTNEEVMSRVHPDDLPALRKVLTSLNEVGKGVGIYRFLGNDGNYRWWSNQMVIIKDKEGKPLYRDGFVRDITEQRRDEEALRQSEETYSTLYTSMVEGVALHEIVRNAAGESVDYRVTDINTAYERIIGIKKNDVVGKLATEVYGTTQAPYLDTYSDVALNGRPVTFETYFSPMDRHFRISVFSPSKDKFATVFEDITLRKKAEMEAERLANALNAMSDINRALSRVTDEKIYMNEVCKAIVRDTKHSMVWVGFAEKDEAKTVRPVAYAGFDSGYIKQVSITWADTERGRGPTGTAIRTGKVAVCRNMLTDPMFTPWRGEAIKRGYTTSIVLPLKNVGKTFGVISIYSKDPDPWSKEEIDLLQQIADDFSLGIVSIREREAKLKAEEDLRVSKERVQEYANRLEQMVEERTAKLLESEETLHGFMNSSDEGYSIYDSELRLLDINRASLRRMLVGAKKDDLLGKKITEIYPGIEHTQWYPAYLEVLRTGKTYNGEGRSVTTVGDLWLSASAFKVGDGLGVVSRDITEQRLNEERLRRAKQFDTVNRLGATVAHDLRGPLTVVMQSLEMAASEPGMAPKMLGMAKTNAERALKMIDTFRAGTKEVKLMKMEVNLPKLIRDTVEGVPHPANVILDIKFAEELTMARLDPEITRRVVDNLVRNAVEAMPEGGKLTVSTRREAGEAVIEVHDTGVGISSEASKILFEPLFTSKKGGMGLGLYFVRMATEAHGGSVDFTSKPGEGTTFKVTFPMEDA